MDLNRCKQGSRQLKHLDRILKSHVARPLSLAPNREEIVEFAELESALKNYSKCDVSFNAASQALEAIVKSQIENFPDNIFWDFQAMLRVLYSWQDSEEIKSYAGMILKLQGGFGIHSPIRFQYLHDFTYGFDWARWVAKSPQARKNIHPLSTRFLQRLDLRQQEIVQLIEKDDPVYHPITDGSLRNPYQFSRKAEDETRIHRRLAKAGTVPFKAWQFEPKLEWQKDYTQIREDLSLNLHESSLP